MRAVSVLAFLFPGGSVDSSHHSDARSYRMRDVIALYAPYVGRTLDGEELDQAREILAGNGFSHTLGIVYDEVSPDKVVAHLDVRPELC